MNARTEDTEMIDEDEDGRCSGDDGALRRTLAIVNRRGLHARASARFVQLAETFDAEVTVSRDGLSVGGQSIMGLMMLAAGIGSSIEVSATGPQAAEAMEAITALVADRFGEEA
jgi:phosphocarrier protein HPr